MHFTYEEMERRLPRMRLLLLHATPTCRMQLLRLHAVHVRMQLRGTCLLMRMQVGTMPHAY
jgi:hypothetical protein